MRRDKGSCGGGLYDTVIIYQNNQYDPRNVQIYPRKIGYRAETMAVSISSSMPPLMLQASAMHRSSYRLSVT